MSNITFQTRHVIHRWTVGVKLVYIKIRKRGNNNVYMYLRGYCEHRFYAPGNFGNIFV